MTSICIATDLHGDTDRAMARAARLARIHGARLCVVSVLPDAARDAEMSARRATLEALVANLPDSAGLETEIIVASGEPSEQIHHAALHAKADLMVVGPHHQAGMLDSLRQTTLEKLVKAAPTPVLLVTDPVDHDYASVIAPVDFSPACAAAVRAARTFAPAAAIHLLHSVGVPYQTIVAAPGAVGDVSPMADPTPFIEDAKTRAEAWLAEEPGLLGLTPPVAEPRALPQLLGTVRAEKGGDLICLGAHTKQGFLDRLLGSFTAELIRKPPCDLLIAPGAR
ncbi:universal stress protein [Dinoroseobacter sp. PD6]|uniref:universal stress protein n=1 Tax=Dinoroseobacter sp. PD6 TaxID=3028384 RepID=UPI00237C0DD7|nr:universal stress protein [Dinoroseobacter sp. PD6]MDD9716182.1 universal stress protein [Dinoroseobacter sp. PD6]